MSSSLSNNSYTPPYCRYVQAPGEMWYPDSRSEILLSFFLSARRPRVCTMVICRKEMSRKCKVMKQKPKKPSRRVRRPILSRPASFRLETPDALAPHTNQTQPIFESRFAPESMPSETILNPVERLLSCFGRKIAERLLIHYASQAIIIHYALVRWQIHFRLLAVSLDSAVFGARGRLT